MPLGVTADEVRIVRNAINCTGLHARINELQFHTPAERYIGNAIATGDILSQMSASDYPESLPALFKEYEEADAYEGLPGSGIGSYRNVIDLMKRTRGFYENNVRQLLDEQWDGVYKEYPHHFGNGSIPYFTAIETNLRRIEEMMALRDRAKAF
jgi:hypothetical protein